MPLDLRELGIGLTHNFRDHFFDSGDRLLSILDPRARRKADKDGELTGVHSGKHLGSTALQKQEGKRHEKDCQPNDRVAEPQHPAQAGEPGGAPQLSRARASVHGDDRAIAAVLRLAGSRGTPHCLDQDVDSGDGEDPSG